jgi:acyl-CoA dehydrogenase
MNFAFSEDAEALRAQAARFLADKAPRSLVRQVMESNNSHDAALWAAVASMGWTGVRIPEEYGGSNLSIFELCVLAEEMGRTLAPIPFMSSVALVTEMLLAFGSESQKAQWLPKLAQGSAIGTLAMSEPDAPTPGTLPQTVVRNGQMQGVKVPVPDGMAATFALVNAREADYQTTSWWLVDLTAGGVVRTPVDAIDLVRKQARVEFLDVPAERLGLAPAAPADITQFLLEHIGVLSAFEALGSALAAQEMAIDYAKNRHAFGRVIGSYQAIKHKCADMYIKTTLARGHALYGAWALHTRAAELGLAAAGARMAALDALRYCAEENVEIHGGIGFTWESDCQFFYRRARLMALQYGTHRFWADRLVRALEQRNAHAA